MVGEERSVSFDDLLFVDFSYTFQGVNILGVVSDEQSFSLEEFYKVVRRCWLKSARIEFLRQLEKWLGVLVEIFQLKNCLWIRKIVLQ